LNIVEVAFSVDSDGKGRAAIQTINGEITQLEATTAASSQTLSAAAQRYEQDLIKAGVASQRARVEAEKYEAAQVSAATTATRAYAAEAQAAELSAAKQKAAVESLQRQRSAALIQQMKDEERASAQYIIQQERQRLARQIILDDARARGLLPQAEQQAVSAFGTRRAITAGAQAAGLPGEAGAIGGLGAFGGPLAAVGVGIGLLAGLREAVHLISEAEQSEINLRVAAHNTGQTFLESSINAQTFSRELVANREESVKLASAFGELQLKTGGAIKGSDIGNFATLINAQGLSNQDAARALSGLAHGQAEAFEQLTGHRADLVLDQYAKSIHTTASRLTEMERAQVLSNAALQRSGELADIAALRMDTLNTRWERFKLNAEALFADITRPDALEKRFLALQFGVAQIAEQAGQVGKRQLEDLQANREAVLARTQEEFFSQRQAGYIRAGITENPLAQLADLRQMQQAFQATQALFKSDDAQKFGDQYTVEIHRVEEEVEKLRREASATLDQLGARAFGDNPFIKLFGEGERSLEALRKRFAAFGPEAVKEFERLERAAQAVETFTLRLQTNLKAVGLEFRADFLEKNLVGISAEQQRQLDILQKRFQAAASAPALLREADAYRRGFVFQNDYLLRQDAIRDYEQVRRLRPTGTDEAARAGQKIIDDYILERTKNLPIAARFSPDYLTRELAQDRATALEASAQRLQANIQDEIKRAEAGRYGIELATRELQELAAARTGGSADRDAVRAEFLKITDRLNPAELSGSLRKAIIDASREEAAHQRDLEKEAKDFRAQLVGQGGILYQIKDVLEGKRTPEAGGDLSGGAGLFRKAPAHAFALARQVEDAAQAAALAAARPANNYLSYLNQSALSSDDDNLDEKLNALVRAEIEGKVFADPAALFTTHAARVGVAVEVNKYAQEFFRARPGYSALNDPGVYDAANPYAREFLRAGYYMNLHSSAREREREPLTKADFVDVLSSLVKDGRLKVDAGPAATINIRTEDGSVRTRTIGPAMTPGSPGIP
jgi:hypothetical protein